MNNREYGLVAVGELLGDFIGSEISINLYDEANLPFDTSAGQRIQFQFHLDAQG